MALSLDFNLILNEQVGSRGLGLDDVAVLSGRITEIHNDIQRRRAEGKLEFMSLGDSRDFENQTRDIGTHFKGFDNLVVLGIGGSSLGAKALISALCHPFHNLQPNDKRSGPRIFFPDNSDASTFMGLMEVLDIHRTAFAAITKSGGTAETWAQLLWVRNQLSPDAARRQIVAVRDPERGALRQAATEFGWKSLQVPPGVGGRYSVFTPVGLLPAFIAGIDIGGLLDGARSMAHRCSQPDLLNNPAYLLASVLYLMDTKRGRNIHVFMPYADALRDTSDWFVQLWAESLGKKHATGGHVGPTPLRAIGATDQHSLLQLLMEGPDDKCTLFVGVDHPRRDAKIPDGDFRHSDVTYLSGHSIHELLIAEMKATAVALAKNERPSIGLHLPALDAFHVGELLMLLEITTAVAGALYEVNPFDQPGVEEGKKLACGLLGRPSYEQFREEMQKRPVKKSAWVL